MENPTIFQPVVAIGYALIGSFYVLHGILHFQRFRDLTLAIASRNIPLPATFLTVGSLLQIVAGLSLACQANVEISAVGLAAFTIAASYIFANFWSLKDEARKAAIGTWQTNLALVGALLAIGLR